jgi:hypothetical protein
LVLGAASSVQAQSNPSLSDDFDGMTQWLSHEMAQGLAFNAGSNFDPPREIRGYQLQPDLSLGVGRIPFNKDKFPVLTVSALNEKGGPNLFPNNVLFPNLTLHLRMGLPWRGDAYVRLADATTPPGYKISPTMTAQVQSNSYGFGLRQHVLGDERPTVTLGAHYNHVRGRTRLKGKFNTTINSSFNANSDLNGAIDWSINSFGLTAVVHQSYDAWTPFAGFGYNYATGSVRARLELQSKTFLVSDVIAEGSERPEQSQGRWIFGVQYARPTWSVFANAELKALGQLQYRSFIAQVGFALPFEIGRGVIRRKRASNAADRSRKEKEYEPVPSFKAFPATPKSPAPPEPVRPKNASPDMIFVQ